MREARVDAGKLEEAVAIIQKGHDGWWSSAQGGTWGFRHSLEIDSAFQHFSYVESQ